MSINIVLPISTVEKLESTVTASADPTAATVAWAASPRGTEPTAFVAGVWLGASTKVGHKYRAVTASPLIGLIGSVADIELAADTLYDLYVQVTDSPEIPVRRVGTIRLATNE